MSETTLQFINGSVWTGDPRSPWANGIAVRDGRVQSVGSPGHPDGEVVNLGGRAVLPGLVDAHVHLLPWARGLGGVDLRDCQGVAAIQARLGGAEAGLAPGEWLLAGGFHPDSLALERPHRSMLDAVSAARPIFVRTHDTHGAWVNTAALRASGVTAATPDPSGGRFERDASGEPTGLLVEAAKDSVRRSIPPMSPEAEREALRRGLLEANRLGLTTVQSFEGSDERRRLRELREMGALTLRVAQMVPFRELEESLAQGLRTGDGDEWLHTGCLKLFADGTLGLRTARMLAPYACGGVGQWDVEPDALKATALRASRAGLGVAVHAIGDAGVRSALDAFEAVRATGSRVPLRVEHAQIVSAEDVPRFAALGVAASMQPVHFLTDRDRALAEWGDRCALAYAWGPLRGAGAQLLFGTDAPIEPLDPWATLAAAVGDVGALQPFSSSERKVSFAVALQAMTEAPWRSLGRAGGTLSPGAPADLILVDRGAAELESGRNIGSTQVLLTLAGGRVAHAAGQFAALRPR